MCDSVIDKRTGPASADVLYAVPEAHAEVEALLRGRRKFVCLALCVLNMTKPCVLN